VPVGCQADLNQGSRPRLGLSVQDRHAHAQRHDAEEVREGDMPLMARKAKARGMSGCGCPSGSFPISTKGRGRGWVCQSKTFRVIKKRGRQWKLKPFVKAICPR
jgi:hypothetical protein